jgi:hypothetical protein
MICSHGLVFINNEVVRFQMRKRNASRLGAEASLISDLTLLSDQPTSPHGVSLNSGPGPVKPGEGQLTLNFLWGLALTGFRDMLGNDDVICINAALETYLRSLPRHVDKHPLTRSHRRAIG